MKKVCLLLICFVFLTFTACSQAKPLKESRFLLDTLVEITIYNKNSQDVMSELFDKIQAFENKFSKYAEDSEISQINNNAGTYVNVSEDTFELIEQSLYFSEISDGLFDISIGPLVDLWGINQENPRVPTQREIDLAKEKIGYRNISLNRENMSVSVAEGMSLDTGAIAKGFITDRLVSVLRERKIESALLNLGGNLYLYGTKPDGSDWTIGIRDPFGLQGDYMATVSLKDTSIVTSGIYERYFEADGKRYHHILNPKTGYPEDNELASVSIISPSSTMCDGLSTTCFLLGLGKGMELIESLENAEAIMITRDKKVYLSSGLKNGKIPFKLVDTNYTVVN
ncbi:thiamine biosynthesis lipoprotein ApbE [Thermoclostridium stercorarium subsp. stercorarium DSM 8532]|uniref:FAD:protein FMN transferase n=1 Tax=Thermoclostridium stercorarium (strain ATCC 35414 / DSM 8532 / NCIMB 11754) TaxID=1121335 RepID=L7VQE5_THES1|nr:FAD:protein FMN transferase [Thermoclostridium stercorarium]AGC67783.1 thiamine biosynthesis lipoprotein ApbE [Thermoclostridium stercorarium subsp. stercorarium DSM 8532]